MSGVALTINYLRRPFGETFQTFFPLSLQRQKVSMVQPNWGVDDILVRGRPHIDCIV
jgi:hypothetical protein